MPDQMPRESQLRAALAEAVQYIHMLGVEKVPANVYQRWQDLIAAQDAARDDPGLGAAHTDVHLDNIRAGAPFTDEASDEERAARDNQAL